jgi:hypothetical protein
MSADRKSARCRTRILTDSDRKRNRKEVLANYKTRINIGHHHDRWPPRYNWNIVDSGVKHHKPNLYDVHIATYIFLYCLVDQLYSVSNIWYYIRNQLNFLPPKKKIQTNKKQKQTNCTLHLNICVCFLPVTCAIASTCNGVQIGNERWKNPCGTQVELYL